MIARPNPSRILSTSVALLLGVFVLAQCDKTETEPQALPSVEPVASPAAVPGETPAAKAKTDDPAPGTASPVAPGAAKPTSPATQPAPGTPPVANPAATATPPAPGTAAAIVGPPSAAGSKPVSAVDGDGYEATLVRAVVAAMNPDEEKGWELYKKELHDNELFPQRLKAIRRFNWPYFRRKVSLYLVDDKKPEIRIVRVEQLPKDQVKVFVFNEKSMPTPCHLKKDEKAKGAYRITNCSL